MNATRPMWMLALLVAACTALLAGLWSLARERIEAERRRSELASLAVLLPPGYDNDPIADRLTLAAVPELGSDQPLAVYRARRGKQPLGAVFTAVAPDGYSGAITLLIGVGIDDRVIGVRVTSHRETPGLGDPIERERSDWITGFDGKSADDPSAPRWEVRNDGGDFDQLAGATITPRAVVRAVRRALLWHAANHTTIYAPVEPRDQHPQPP